MWIHQKLQEKPIYQFLSTKQFSDVYGDNRQKKEKQKTFLKQTKHSGLSNGEPADFEYISSKICITIMTFTIITINFFDKSFTSPLSRTGMWMFIIMY